MNNQNFKLNNGYPLNQASLDRMQEAYSIFNALGAIVGDEPVMRATIVTRKSDADFITVQSWDTIAPRLLNFPEPSRFKF